MNAPLLVYEKERIRGRVETSSPPAIERLRDGHSTKPVAEFLGVHLRTVQKWKARNDRRGDAGLASKPALPRMPELTDRQIQTLLGWFKRSPMEFGYSTELWTSRRVRDLIKRTFGVTLRWNYLCRWLTARDVTPQKPNDKLANAIKLASTIKSKATGDSPGQKKVEV